MSDYAEFPELTDTQRNRLRFACSLTLALQKALGIPTCGTFYCADSGFRQQMTLCGCKYPEWELHFDGEVQGYHHGFGSMS